VASTGRICFFTHPRENSMVPSLRSSLLLFPLALLFILGGCASKVENRPEDVRLVHLAYRQQEYFPSPSFLISEWQHSYNRIGMVRANRDDQIFIDPEKPVFYFSKRSFTTNNDTYTNLIYRIHFAKTPFSLFPYYLAAGDNTGVLVVITVDQKNRPLLVTAVNTCGCYVSVIPTNYLPAQAYPASWSNKGQHIYGEVLPAKIKMENSGDKLLITIRPAVHRVMDMGVVDSDAMAGVRTTTAEALPLSILKSLQLPTGGTTSMFYDSWPLKGHVKGAVKPWETLLLSLLSMDLFVGMDKEYGNTTESGNPFYTSLKPWNRQASDMNNFAEFLKFYGWKL